MVLKMKNPSLMRRLSLLEKGYVRGILEERLHGKDNLHRRDMGRTDDVCKIVDGSHIVAGISSKQQSLNWYGR